MTTGFVLSEDGTVIGYRQLGVGPGVLLVHGGLMSSHNLMKLGHLLSGNFTVCIPDRRGRGSSGSFGDNYGIEREREDIKALLEKTGAQLVFGLSSGAIIALHAALTLPIRKLVLYEPPLLVPGFLETTWVPRYRREIARGKLASAMVTILKGTADRGVLALIPRFLLVPFFHVAIQAESKDIQDGQVPLRDLIPTMRFDTQLVAETEDALESFRAVRADVLLLGGAKSARYLRGGLDALGAVLPNATRIELPGVGHIAADTSGKPELVAERLLSFF